MAREAPLKLSVETYFTSVTCPSIRLDPSKWVKLRLCFLGFHLSTRAVRAHFPLIFNEKMLIERTFPLCLTPMQLFSALAGEKIIIELVEICLEPKVLALFDGDIINLLFGSPPLMRVNETRNHYMTLLLNPTQNCAGILNPHLDTTINVTLFQVPDAVASCATDEALNMTLGLYATEHPYYAVPHRNPFDKLRISPHACRMDLPPRPCQRMAIASPKCKPVSPKRQPFVVRHVEEKLIGRTPSLQQPACEHGAVLDRGYTMARTLKCPHRSLHRQTSQLDTHSSLQRRRSHIVKPVSRLVFPDDFESNWCAAGRRYCVPTTGEKNYCRTDDLRGPCVCREILAEEREMSNMEHQGGSEFNCGCHCSHDPAICTLCQLYKKYFGQSYPRHSIE